MREAARRAVKTRIFYVVLLAVGLACTLLGLWLGGQGVSASELQRRLVDSCEESRAPLSDYFRAEIGVELDAITEAAETDPDLFPDIPPAQFQALIAQSIAAGFERISRLVELAETFDPAECAAQYDAAD